MLFNPARVCFVFLFMSCILGRMAGAEASTIESSTVINLPANNLILDPTRNLLYASVPSAGGVGVGNTITRIGLGSQAILDSTFIGSEPGDMALSSDGSQMYVSITGSDKIRAFNPTTLTAGQQVTVWNNELIADMAVVPSHPDTYVGSMVRSGSPLYVGIGVWHFDGTNFTTNGAVGIAAFNLAYSSDPTIFYATSGQTLAKVTLGPGDSLSAQYAPPLGATDPPISLGGNLLVSAAGRAADLTNFTAAGLFTGGPWSAVAVDAALHKVFLVHGQTLSVFDTDTFIKIDSLIIPQIGTGQALDLIRFGANGLAFRTDQSKVILIDTNAVPEPSSFILAAFGLVGLAAWGWRQRKCA
jgi:DNA-binding beta-propeller fold protein YncE